MTALPDPFPVEPLARPFDAAVRSPGSKSLTNRAYVLAALADGTSRIERPLRSDDCDRLLAALVAMGARATWDGDDVIIDGVAGRFPRGGRVDLADGGTPTRFMIAAACLAAEPVVVDGSPRMRERPVSEGIDLLRGLGADIEYVDADGRLPVRVRPASLHGGELAVGRTASSQFISAVMLIAPFLPAPVQLVYDDEPTSASYIRLTVASMKQWGVGVTGSESAPQQRHEVAPTTVGGRRIAIEPDASSALYIAAAAAVVPGSAARLVGLTRDSVQPDIAALAVLESAGLVCDVDAGGSLCCRGPDELRPIDADLSAAPDGALAVAAVCARASGTSRLTGLHTLRVKETDRIGAVRRGLEAIGCRVASDDDSITIDPAPRHERPALIRTENDHRMAMAFAVLGLARPGISIENPDCVAKSHPGFWGELASLRG